MYLYVCKNAVLIYVKPIARILQNACMLHFGKVSALTPCVCLSFSIMTGYVVQENIEVYVCFIACTLR